ncbi:MAG: contractile injection system protein, VgrG/Pvc8 family, partial [Myxococcota bacterium]|nr:contractile injection system protein, VgrG/Pvc8 family [Myxococcota bacterium]
MTLARRAWAEVVYQGKDISQDLQPYLLGVSYTDHQGGKADEVSIDLQDRDALWRGDWLPGQGDTVQVRIHADEWGEGGGTLFCGTFTLDKLGLAGPPSTVKLSGVSVPTGLAARKTKRSRAWENASLQTIAGDVAASARMRLVFDATDTPPLDRVDQRSETDLAFLARLADERHYALKVTDNQLVVWSIAD